MLFFSNLVYCSHSKSAFIQLTHDLQQNRVKWIQSSFSRLFLFLNPNLRLLGLKKKKINNPQASAYLLQGSSLQDFEWEKNINKDTVDVSLTMKEIVWLQDSAT